jgi:aldose 1-epimerase
MALTGREYVICAGAHTATISEVGARLHAYTYDGVDVVCTYPGDALPPKGAGSVLMPWPNRLRGGRYHFDGEEFQLPLTEPTAGNAIHGLARWVRWDSIAHESDSVTMRHDLVPQTGWPFEVAVEIHYAVHPDDGLAVTARAVNNGARRAPFGAGFHPYLSTRGATLEATTVRLPAASRLVVDDAQVPVGLQPVDGTQYDLRSPKKLEALRMDDGFTDLSTTDGRGWAEVIGAGGGARLWFDEAYRYLQAFTVDELTPGTPAVAIEPMTCAPDAFNSGDGLIILEPGAQWSGTWGITPTTTTGRLDS